MIVAHNTFTYLKTNLFMELFSFLWRCQNKSIDILYNKYNVKFFDIRISKKRSWFKKEFLWVFTHGLVKFNDKIFENIESIFLYMKMYYPNAQYRLILERCSKKEKYEFYKQLEPWLEKNGRKLKEHNYLCSCIGIKKPWKYIYKNNNLYPGINDYACHLFNLNQNVSQYENIKNFNIKQTIKNWATKNNPILTEEQINDNKICYFMDYI